MVNTQIARSPLSGAKHGNEATVLLQEVAFTKGFDLRVDPDSAGFQAINTSLGLTLGSAVGQVVKTESVSALTLGPDWWYLTGTADIAALINPIKEEHHLSLVDVSSQRTKIEVSGPNAKDVLAHYWEQDLREDHFGLDRCSQGAFAKAPVILWHCCDNCYILFARSSFAAHLWTALVDATIDYVK